jgi:hypothetical protein
MKANADPPSPKVIGLLATAAAMVCPVPRLGRAAEGFPQIARRRAARFDLDQPR